MEIPRQLHKEIIEYCKLNSIEDVDKFILKTLSTGFTIAKYGVQPIVKPKEEIIPENIFRDESGPVEKNKTKNKDDLYGEG